MRSGLTPAATMLAAVPWVAVDAPDDAQSQGEDALPYVTHRGELEIGGQKLRCYRISTGQALIDADDMNAFFGGAA